MPTPDHELDADAALSRLEQVKEKRGYLLAHHGLLALTAPELLEGYDACYTALTLGERYLSQHDKEFIWLGILAVKEEHLATQHVRKFLDAGGSIDLIRLSVRLAAYAYGSEIFEFSEKHWKQYDPSATAKAEYFSGLKALCGATDIDQNLLHLAMLAIQTSRRGWQALRWHLEHVYELKTPEVYIAEALSYAMFTGSIPNFIEGCDLWRSMINAGKLEASAPFKKWAQTEQDGPK
ncbi:MAG: hypothetical protein RIF37_00495 [Rhodospirillaceae bacterium]